MPKFLRKPSFLRIPTFDKPELASPYGYAATLLVMLAISLALLVFFRRKKWI